MLSHYPKSNLLKSLHRRWSCWFPTARCQTVTNLLSKAKWDFYLKAVFFPTAMALYFQSSVAVQRCLGTGRAWTKRRTSEKELSQPFMTSFLGRPKSNKQSLYAQLSWRAAAPWPQPKRPICPRVIHSCHLPQSISDAPTTCQAQRCAEILSAAVRLPAGLPLPTKQPGQQWWLGGSTLARQVTQRGSASCCFKSLSSFC